MNNYKRNIDYYLEDTNKRLCDDNHIYDKLYDAVIKRDYNLLKNILLNNKSFDLNKYKDKNNDTLLLVTAFLGFHEILEILIKAGADVNLRGFNGYTALHYVALEDAHRIGNASEDYCKCLKILLDIGANVNQEDDYGQIALHLSADKCNNYNIIMLIKAGENINKEDLHENTPLSLAVKSDYHNCECVKELIMNGANINNKINNKFAFHYMMENGILCECIDTFIKLGVDINIKLNNKTILMELVDQVIYKPNCYLKITDVYKAFGIYIKAGGKINDINDYNCNILHYVFKLEEKYTFQLINLLIEANVNKNQKNIYGITPIDIAYYKNYDECIKLLLEYSN